jgi:K+-sensing histidine kinase KdpD
MSSITSVETNRLKTMGSRLHQKDLLYKILSPRPSKSLRKRFKFLKQVEEAVECVYCDVFRIDARDAIVDFSKEVDASLVVVGKRGLGAIKSLLLGSVSTYVMQNAHWYEVVIQCSDCV